MSLDLGTLSGVLGIVLTVIFFFVGYRQTIGARKERAAAANREIVDALLRRFTLDSGFTLQYDEIERFITGKALSNRVKVADIYAMEEIYSLLYAQIISSDYVAPKTRKPVLEKLNRCFRPTDGPSVYESSANEVVDKVRSYIEILLGVGSALLAAAASVATAATTRGWLNGLSISSFRWELFVAIGVSGLTAIALVVFARLRDKAVATTAAETTSVVPKAREFEAQILARLQAVGVPFTQHRDVDLIIHFKDRRVALELKLYPPPPTRLAPIIHQMEMLLEKYGCDEGFIVIASPISDKIRNLSFGRIKLFSTEEFFKLLTAPEPLRGAGHHSP